MIFWPKRKKKKLLICCEISLLMLQKQINWIKWYLIQSVVGALYLPGRLLAAPQTSWLFPCCGPFVSVQIVCNCCNGTGESWEVTHWIWLLSAFHRKLHTSLLLIAHWPKQVMRCCPSAKVLRVWGWGQADSQPAVYLISLPHLSSF